MIQDQGQNRQKQFHSCTSRYALHGAVNEYLVLHNTINTMHRKYCAANIIIKSFWCPVIHKCNIYNKKKLKGMEFYANSIAYVTVSVYC